MKITAARTIQVAADSGLVWVEPHTDQGLTGLGETFRNPEATSARRHAPDDVQFAAGSPRPEDCLRQRARA
jgi:galactonate dehydratase